MTDDTTPSLFDNGGHNFEELAERNGTSWWSGDALMAALGYQTDASFMKAVMRAQKACLTLGIPTEENFERETVVDTASGTSRVSYRLTRFACYLVAMNGDTRNPRVAKAQAYFASIAQAFQDAIADAENVERVVIRDELTEGQKSLQSTAKQHGATNFAFFNNAGYRGMYNMNLSELKSLKGVPEGKTPFDYMGRRELAANLFRVTQTEQKIETERIRGQKPLERAAESVGRRVRQAMVDTGGTAPEHLPTREPISKVKSGLKKTRKGFQKLDSPAKRR